MQRPPHADAHYPKVRAAASSSEMGEFKVMEADVRLQTGRSQAGRCARTQQHTLATDTRRTPSHAHMRRQSPHATYRLTKKTTKRMHVAPDDPRPGLAAVGSQDQRFIGNAYVANNDEVASAHDMTTTHTYEDDAQDEARPGYAAGGSQGERFIGNASDANNAGWQPNAHHTTTLNEEKHRQERGPRITDTTRRRCAHTTARRTTRGTRLHLLAGVATDQPHT